jgi:uncharacterized integral membrane protein
LSSKLSFDESIDVWGTGLFIWDLGSIAAIGIETWLLLKKAGFAEWLELPGRRKQRPSKSMILAMAWNPARQWTSQWPVDWWARSRFRKKVCERILVFRINFTHISLRNDFIGKNMRNFKIIFASVLVILVAIIVLQNREPVPTHLLFVTVVMPHAILLFITAATGFALGALLALSLTKRKQNSRWRAQQGLDEGLLYLSANSASNTECWWARIDCGASTSWFDNTIAGAICGAINEKVRIGSAPYNCQVSERCYGFYKYLHDGRRFSVSSVRSIDRSLTRY